jgi:hypothetical protein
MGFRVPAAALASTLSLAFLGACASPPPSAAGTAVTPQTAAADQQVCTREVPVGSLRPVTRCRTRAQAIQEEEEARKALGATRQQGAETTDRIGR